MAVWLISTRAKQGNPSLASKFNQRGDGFPLDGLLKRCYVTFPQLRPGDFAPLPLANQFDGRAQFPSPLIYVGFLESARPKRHHQNAAPILRRCRFTDSFRLDAMSHEDLELLLRRDSSSPRFAEANLGEYLRGAPRPRDPKSFGAIERVAVPITESDFRD